MRVLLISLCLLCLPSFVEADSLKILVLGDSMLASNRDQGKAVSQILRQELGAEVKDRAMPAAKIIHRLPLTGALGMRIPSQLRARDIDAKWDWIVVNGGGNDLWLACGCSPCKKRMGKMLNEDASQGVIVDFTERMAKSGANILWLGYLRTPGFPSPVDGCAQVGGIYEARLEALAKQKPKMRFVSLDGIVPDGDKSYHAADRIHPSAKGSKAIAQRVMDAMKSASR